MSYTSCGQQDVRNAQSFSWNVYSCVQKDSAMLNRTSVTFLTKVTHTLLSMMYMYIKLQQINVKNVVVDIFLFEGFV